MAENMKLDVINPSTAPHRHTKLNGLDYRKRIELRAVDYLSASCGNDANL